ncbi:DUF2087 domain-containing protein [Gulosibacter faecalis]|uniref:DUF2087 domain-containing protein n=1 Tax=Gulosibacter faecalis TaxID=272240 RepID=A0ABW5UY25_9MICO|nr:DUF2087 domain-containing protein [Gulosibacter faecalis]
MAAEWRNVIALFVNEQTRHVAGRLLAGESVDPEALELSPSRRRHVVTAITNSGIAALTDDGVLALTPDVFPRLLAEGARPARTGIARFLVNDRIVTYPSAPAEREELLRWVRDRAIGVDETLTESELNDRLAKFHDDVAVLRRYLVDFELLERRPDGAEYRRVREV